MPLSIDHFNAAVAQYPNAEALVSQPNDEGITQDKAPRIGLLTFFGIGSYFDEVKKSSSIVKSFQNALKEKYGGEISNFVFPEEMQDSAATSSLKSRTVQAVLQKAEILDLLKEAIIETMTEKDAYPEPEDSPFRNVPGIAEHLFPKETIESIKEAYYDSLKATNKFMTGESDRLDWVSLPSVQRAKDLVKANLQAAGLDKFSSCISEYFPVKAMRAAMEANADVRESIFAPLKPPVTTLAAYTTPPSFPMVMASREIDSSIPSSPIAQAAPLTPVQHAIRIHDPEWNI